MSDMLPRPEPRDAFKRALRAQLMAQAPGALARRETAWSRFQVGWMRPALAVAAVLLIVMGGAGKAAADSLPGDLSYPLKRAAEQVQLALAIDDTTRIQVLAEQTDHRLADLATAIESRPDKAPTASVEYAEAVRQFTLAVDALRGKPDTSIDKRTLAEDVVDAAHLKHQAVLDELQKRVIPSERPDAEKEIANAKQVSDKLHASDRPARTPEPAERPDRSRSPQPTRTSPPARSASPSVRR